MVTDGIIASQLASAAPGSTGNGLSTQSIERFQQAYGRATTQADGADSISRAASSATALLNPLLNLNSDSARLALQAGRAAEQTELKPSELMMLTMRSHEFLFHCELTANVANRSSDGLQQLFRQQS